MVTGQKSLPRLLTGMAVHHRARPKEVKPPLHVARRIEAQHAGSAEHDYEQGQARDIAEAAAVEVIANRVHAAVGGSDDPHQPGAPQRPRGTQDPERLEQAQGRGGERQNGQPGFA